MPVCVDRRQALAYAGVNRRSGQVASVPLFSIDCLVRSYSDEYFMASQTPLSGIINTGGNFYSISQQFPPRL